MTIDEVLDIFGNGFAICCDSGTGFDKNLSEAKLALLEIILNVKPEKKLASRENGFNLGFNQGIDEFELNIKELFK